MTADEDPAVSLQGAMETTVLSALGLKVVSTVPSALSRAIRLLA
jgi:hypothetical protein